MTQTQAELGLSHDIAFFSYASEDRERVREIHQAMKKAGFSPWLDVEDLLPGDDWDFTIRNSIRAAKCVLVFLSTNSVTKRGYVQREIAEALDVAAEMPEGRVFIIPVRLERCDVPKRLSKWQYIDLYQSRGVERLLASLHKHGVPTVPTRRELLHEVDASALREEALDELLRAKFIQRDTFLYAELDSRKMLISDYAFMELRDKIPPRFAELENQLGRTRELSQSGVLDGFPSSDEYRRKECVVTAVTVCDENPRLRVLHAKSGTECVVDADYIGYVTQRYPDSVLYLVDTYSPVMIETGGELIASLMPMK